MFVDQRSSNVSERSSLGILLDVDDVLPTWKKTQRKMSSIFCSPFPAGVSLSQTKSDNPKCFLACGRWWASVGLATSPVTPMVPKMWFLRRMPVSVIPLTGWTSVLCGHTSVVQQGTPSKCGEAWTKLCPWLKLPEVVLMIFKYISSFPKEFKRKWL